MRLTGGPRRAGEGMALTYASNKYIWNLDNKENMSYFVLQLFILSFPNKEKRDIQFLFFNSPPPHARVSTKYPPKTILKNWIHRIASSTVLCINMGKRKRKIKINFTKETPFQKFHFLWSSLMIGTLQIHKASGKHSSGVQTIA